jgi:acylphosphatase
MKNHSAEMVRNRIIIAGKVQGVGYRKFVVAHALALNLSGFCRNLPSGEVEVDVEGAHEKVQELIRYLQMGPSRGHVDQVIVSPSLEPLSESTFVIRY